jgi:hypothetical protein
METLFGLVILILDLVAIVDVVRGSLATGKKVLWGSLIILFPVLGVLLYYLLGRSA